MTVLAWMATKTCHVCYEKDALIKSLQDQVANLNINVSTLAQNIKTLETKVTYQNIDKKRSKGFAVSKIKDDKQMKFFYWNTDKSYVLCCI